MKNDKYKYKRINGILTPYHRYVWELNFGTIPKGYVIHHIDEDKSNNDISNLQMMTRAEHIILHHDEGKNSKDISYYQTEKNKEYQKQYREKNKEKRKEYQLEYSKNYYENNKEKKSLYSKEHYEKNKESILLRQKRNRDKL